MEMIPSKADEYLIKFFGPKPLGFESDITATFVTEFIHSLSYVTSTTLFAGFIGGAAYVIMNILENHKNNTDIGAGKKTQIVFSMICALLTATPGYTGSFVSDLFIKAVHRGSQAADDLLRIASQLVIQPVASRSGGALSTVRDTAQIRLNGHVRTRICKDQMFRDGYANDPVIYKKTLVDVCGFNVNDVNAFYNRIQAGEKLTANDERWKQLIPGDALINTSSETPEGAEAQCIASAGEAIIKKYVSGYDADNNRVELTKSAVYTPITIDSALGSAYPSIIGALVSVSAGDDNSLVVNSVPVQTKMFSSFSSGFKPVSLLSIPQYTTGSVSECLFNARMSDYLAAADRQSKPYQKAYEMGWIGAGAVADTFSSDVAKMQDRMAVAAEEKPVNVTAVSSNNNDPFAKATSAILQQAIDRYDTFSGSKRNKNGNEINDLTNLGSSTINGINSAGRTVSTYADKFYDGAWKLTKGTSFEGLMNVFGEQVQVAGIAKKTIGAAIQTCATGSSINSYYNKAASFSSIPLPASQCDMFKNGGSLEGFKTQALFAAILIQFSYLLPVIAMGFFAARWLISTLMYAIVAPIALVQLPLPWGWALARRVGGQMLMTCFYPLLAVIALITGGIAVNLIDQLFFELLLPELSLDTLKNANGFWDFASWAAGLFNALMTGEIIVKLVLYGITHVATMLFLAISINSIPEWVIGRFGMSDPHSGIAGNLDNQVGKITGKFDAM